MSEKTPLPTCLVFSGHDPSGAAGVQADIEALAGMGAHAATLVTALTVQDTFDVHMVEPVSALLLMRQARILLADITPAAVKIGLVPDVATVEAIHNILTGIPEVPVVLDPVIRAGGGSSLQNAATGDALQSLLFPLATVITPNMPEAKRFAANADTLDTCGFSLLESGCGHVLITGGHGEGGQVVNRLYGDNRLLDTFRWPRLPHKYHGSGCTLASSMAGLLSHGHEPHLAAREAQQYTWDALNNAYRVGCGQLQPHRFYRVSKFL